VPGASNETTEQRDNQATPLRWTLYQHSSHQFASVHGEAARFIFRPAFAHVLETREGEHAGELTTGAGGTWT